MTMHAMQDMDVKNKTVLLRLDLNVPVVDGVVSDHTRITRVKGTILGLRAAGAKIVILSHYGRPKGRADKDSLAFLPPVLAADWGCHVAFAPDCIGPAALGAVSGMQAGDVLLLENLRFHAGEEANDMDFARALAALGDVYVNDAFSVSHRAHASVHALAGLLPAAAGLAMQAELTALAQAVGTPVRPVAAIVGGAKISTKLDLLMNLISCVDYLILGGGMANTFLAASGWAPQKSLVEPDMYATARKIMESAATVGCKIILPSDIVVADRFAADASARTVPLNHIAAHEMALDIGPDSVAIIVDILGQCKTIVWNGPLGAFELPPFAVATTTLARAVAASTLKGQLISVAGGGDTVAALAQAGVEPDLTYVSAAGGAFLEWLEGKVLPGVDALAKSHAAA